MTVDAPSRLIESSTAAPALSVVIANVNGLETLAPTLDSIDRLPERTSIEVIVVDSRGGLDRRALLSREPKVRVVEADRRSIPRLRYLGVVEARGDLIAILEDHAEVATGWATALVDEHRDPTVAAVGGPVENGRDGAINRAVFLCEYATYMGPVVEGPHHDLPGNNIAFKRDDLLKHAHLLDAGKWESWIVARLREEGGATVSTNRAEVRHIKSFRLGYFLSQRFHFGRSYAGMRRTDQTWPRRLVYAAGSTALPPLLLARWIGQLRGKRKPIGEWLPSSPLVALFFTVGALGEAIGYLLGPGRSLERVE